jgi:hypothetical protein
MEEGILPGEWEERLKSVRKTASPPAGNVVF